MFNWNNKNRFRIGVTSVKRKEENGTAGCIPAVSLENSEIHKTKC